MSDDQKQEAPKVPLVQIARLLIGIILFGGLMGLREEFDSIWIRMIVAGCAGGVLALFVLPLRKYRSRKLS